MLEYYRSVPLREGFDDFLDLTDRKGIPVVLLSGGLEPFVKEILGDRFDRFLAVHCVGVDTSDGFMLDRVGVPRDSKWRGLILYMRSIKNYDFLDNEQKEQFQALVMGLAANYCPSTIAVFLTSLEQAGFRGTLVLFVTEAMSRGRLPDTRYHLILAKAAIPGRLRGMTWPCKIPSAAGSPWPSNPPPTWPASPGRPTSP